MAARYIVLAACLQLQTAARKFAHIAKSAQLQGLKIDDVARPGRKPRLNVMLMTSIHLRHETEKQHAAGHVRIHNVCMGWRKVQCSHDERVRHLLLWVD